MSSKRFEVGFMQGRLSPRVDGKIQAFPWDHWEQEFPLAQQLDLTLMEWTLDHERLAENPLMTPAGQARISQLSQRHNVRVGSLTGDIFMQAPFWRVDGAERTQRLRELDSVIDACASTGIHFIVVPLVDAGAMLSAIDESVVIDAFLERDAHLRAKGVRIVFECDYRPALLARFIAKLPAPTFGINYDIGNSAALGYDCGEEIAAYGTRILNVHIKDRVLNGTTVPLGTGNADLPRAIELIIRTGYDGSFVMQTARAQDDDHMGALRRYRDMAHGWIARAAA